MRKESSLSLLKVIASTMVLFFWNIIGNKLSDYLSLSKPTTWFLGAILFIMVIWVETDFQTPKFPDDFTELISKIFKFILVVITIGLSVINLYSLRYGIDGFYFIFSSILLYGILGGYMVGVALQLLKRSDMVRWFSLWYFILGVICLSLVILFVYRAVVLFLT